LGMADYTIPILLRGPSRLGLRSQFGGGTGAHPTGLKVTDAQRVAVRREPSTFHGEWNYTILPQSNPSDPVITG